MDFGRLSRGELIAIGGALLLAVAVFLPWYHAGTRFVVLAGEHGVGTYSGWKVHTTMRFLLLAAAAAPLILSYIVVRNHQLSWPRGQLTSVIAIAALGLVVYNGLISKPGNPSSQVHLRIGWVAALVGVLLMLAGSILRQSETEIKRRPPGTFSSR